MGDHQEVPGLIAVLGYPVRGDGKTVIELGVHHSDAKAKRKKYILTIFLKAYRLVPNRYIWAIFPRSSSPLIEKSCLQGSKRWHCLSEGISCVSSLLEHVERADTLGSFDCG